MTGDRERAASGAPPLALRHISKSFGITRALDDVTLELHAGEIHALLGENGAGKTTLMRMAYGLEQPDGGEIIVGEGRTARSVRIESPRVARRLGIGMVHQHFTSIPALTVAENVALAAGWRESGRRLERRAARTIAEVRLPLDPAAPAGTLSVQLRQRLEIVQALAAEARVLLLDEPTAVLAPREVAELMSLVRHLADTGNAVVLISHKLREIREIADRVTVLKGGRVTLSGVLADHDDTALSRAMIGDDPTSAGTASERRGLHRSSRLTDSGTPGAVRITVEQEGGAPISWHAGEVVGIAAVEGNGQRQLLRAIAGLEPPPPGLTLRTDGDAGFIAEDRTTEGLIGTFSLTENYALGLLDRLPQWLDWRQLRDATQAVIVDFDVRAESPESRAIALSGGNQQKFVLGRTFDRHPDIVVAEDATRGLDLRATATIHERLRRAARGGAVVVFHASDLDEVIALADRLMVMHHGRLSEWPRGATRAVVGDAMLGLDPDAAPR